MGYLISSYHNIIKNPQSKVTLVLALSKMLIDFLYIINTTCYILIMDIARTSIHISTTSYSRHDQQTVFGEWAIACVPPLDTLM